MVDYLSDRIVFLFHINLFNQRSGYMIIISVIFEASFSQQIKTFCCENDLQIDRICLGNQDCYNITGETYDIDKLLEYVEQLEQNSEGYFVIWNKFIP